MKYRLKNLFYLLTTKIILLCILIVLPLNIMLIIFTRRAMNNLEEQVQLSIQNIADVYMSTLDSRMAQVNYYFYKMMTENSSLLTLRSTEDETEYINARWSCYLDMHNEISLNSDCDACFLCVEGTGDYIISQKNSRVNQEASYKSYLEDNIDETNRWQIRDIEGTRYAVRVAKWANVYYGAFINLDSEVQEVYNSINYTNRIVSFIDGKNRSADDYVTAVSLSNLSDFGLSIQVARRDIWKTISFWEQGQIVTSFLFIGVLPVLYLAINQWVLKPLQELNQAHHELEVGNEDFRIQNPGNSLEFHEAYASFNEMADNIHSLKLENMEKELAKKQLQLTNLQLQVRPHFLLNTFN